MRAITAGVVLVTLASPARAEVPGCSVARSIEQFDPNSRTPSKFSQGYTTSLEIAKTSSGGRRVVVSENYGYGAFTIGSQGRPQLGEYRDMSTTIPQAGDGQSLVIGVGGAADGSRMLVGWKQSPHGTILMKSSFSSYMFAGDYSSSRPSGGLVVDENGGRYIGFSLSQLGLVAADITTLSEVEVTQAGSISREVIGTAPVSAYINNLTLAGHFLVYHIGTKVVLVDVRTVGTASSFARYFTVKTYLPATFGLPSSHLFANVTATVHPNGKLYIAAETADASGASSGIGLASTSLDTISLQQAAEPFLTGARSTQATSFVTTPGDALLLAWANDVVSGAARLVTLSINGWGTDRTPDFTVDSAQEPNFWQPAAVRAYEEDGRIYAYTAARGGAFSLGLDCVAVPAEVRGDADASGHVDVSDVLHLIAYLYAGGPEPASATRGDADGDGKVATGDVLFLINYLFAGGPPPA